MSKKPSILDLPDTPPVRRPGLSISINTKPREIKVFANSPPVKRPVLKPSLAVEPDAVAVAAQPAAEPAAVAHEPAVIPFQFPSLSFCDFITGDYQRSIIKREVGRGASARVYEFQYHGQPYLVREIRMISYDDFVRECKILQLLQHSLYVMKLFGACYMNGVGYMLLESVPGRTMSAWLKEETTKTNPNERVRIYRELIEGLKTIHGVGYVHLDIKPDNIWIPIDPRRPAFYLDFGLAQPESAPMTLAILRAGTKSYLPANVESLETLKQRNYWALGRVIGEFDNFSFRSGKTGTNMGYVDYKLPTNETTIGKVVKTLQTKNTQDFNGLAKILSDSAVTAGGAGATTGGAGATAGGAAGNLELMAHIFTNLPENVMGPKKPEKFNKSKAKTRRNKKLTRRHRRA